MDNPECKCKCLYSRYPHQLSEQYNLPHRIGTHTSGSGQETLEVMPIC